MKIGVSSKKLSQRDMTVLALWTIRPQLMAVPGVANVAIWGQRDKQFQVLVDPDRLRANQSFARPVIKAAQDAVALDAGGFVDTPNQRLAVRQRPAVADADDLARTVVVVPQRHAAAPGRRGRRADRLARRRSATRSSTTAPACC